MDATEMPIDRWMDKEDVVHTYGGVVLSHKKEWTNAPYRNTDGPRENHGKRSKTEKDK